MSDIFVKTFSPVFVDLWTKDFLQVVLIIPRKNFLNLPDYQPIGYATLCVGGQVIGEADLNFTYFSNDEPDDEGELPVQVYKAQISVSPIESNIYDTTLTVTIDDLTCKTIRLGAPIIVPVDKSVVVPETSSVP